MNDLISRQAAIDALDEQITLCDKALGSFDISMEYEYAVKVERASLEAYRETLTVLPSAQPERKKGKWERHYTRQNVYAGLCWHCSVCGYKNADNYLNVYYNYCPNCGADMRGEQDAKVR